MLLVLALTSNLPVDAQSDSLDELRAEKREVDADRLANAKGIDAASAEIGELNEALETLRTWINSQTIVVATSRQAAESARLELGEAQTAVAEISTEIVSLNDQIRDQAVRSFLDFDDGSALLTTGDPNSAVRRESLSRHLLGSNDDLRDRLSFALAEQEVRQQDVVVAARRADETHRIAEEDLAELTQSSDEHRMILDEAEARLEHLVSERDALAALDVQVSRELSRAEAALATLLGGAGGAAGAGSAATTPELVTPGDIVDAGYGVKVHSSIAANVTALLEAARADGVNLAGGGYRDSSAQIRLRRKNCGTSDYAIYEMPASRCRPPTARPGASMHEQGMAIDFTSNGRLIRSRSGAGWNWLKANAGTYGLFNLPTEPWHWSVNGR